MFGLIRPCLSKENKTEYKCYYCGLCMGMGRCTGFLSRILINYDFCIAYLVADSIYTETEYKKKICPFSPLKIVKYRDNPDVLNKMAERNYILTYHKVLDDILDDNSMVAKILERCMRKRYLEVSEKNKAATEAIIKRMQLLHQMEKENSLISIKDAAIPFGELLEDVMSNCLEDPLDAQVFSSICKYLGMWIYTIDACMDFSKDMKNGKYNPIFAGYEIVNENIFSERKEEITEFLMECKSSMQQLLGLLSCAKNEELVYSIFEHILPYRVAELLK